MLRNVLIKEGLPERLSRELVLCLAVISRISNLPDKDQIHQIYGTLQTPGGFPAEDGRPTLFLATCSWAEIRLLHDDRERCDEFGVGTETGRVDDKVSTWVKLLLSVVSELNLSCVVSATRVLEHGPTPQIVSLAYD